MKPVTIKKKPALAASRKTTLFKKARKAADKPNASKDESQIDDESDAVVEREVVAKAVKQLRAGHSGADRAVYLQVLAAKIPDMRTTTLNVPLKHRIFPAGVKMVLITPDLKGDLKPDEKNIEHYKKLLASKGIKSISEIIPLHKMKAEYRDNEAKTKLLKLYDLIICDIAVIKFVKKTFSEKLTREQRIAGLKLRVTNLKGALDKLLVNAQMIIHSKGDSFIMNTGHTSMKDAHLVDNILAAADGIKAKYPGGIAKILKLDLKTPKGKAVEVYKSLAAKAVKAKAPKVEEGTIISPKKTQKKEVKVKTVKKAVTVKDQPKDSGVPVKKVAIKRKNMTTGKESKVAAKKKAKVPAI